MKTNSVLLLFMILTTAISTSGWCQPELVYIEGGTERKIDGIEDLKPYYIDEGEKRFFTEGGQCFLRKNDDDILSWGYAPVSYIIKHDNADTLSALVYIDDESRESAWNRFQTKSLLKLWDEGSIKNAFFFLGWYEPKSDLLRISDLRASHYNNGQLIGTGFSIDLVSREKGDFPVIFLWKDNRLIPPKSFGEDNEDFFRSIILGQMELLENIEKPNSLYKSEDIFGNKAIHYAAAFGHEDILKKFLDEGAEINARNKNKMSPLLLASAAGHKNIVDLLLQYNAKANSVDNDKRSAIHYASYLGHEAIVKELLIKYDRNINEEDVFNYTPVHYAINENNDSIMRLLAGSKAKLDVDKVNLQTVLVGNISNDNYNIVSFLLDQKANADEELHGTTPLIVAAGTSSLEVVDLLINSGANVNKSNANQVTPLLSACLTGRLEVVKYLLEKEAEVNAKSANGLSAIEAAVLRNDPEMIDLLISYGVDIDTKDESGMTPFWIAAGLGYRESMKRLLNAGASCNLNHKVAIDLMELAFRYDMPEAVSLALNQCLEADFLFYGKYPSTWVAEYYDADEILELLIESGAKKDTGEGLGLVPMKDLSEKPEILESTSIYYPLELKRKYGSGRFTVQVIINEQGNVLFPNMLDSEIPEIDRIVMETITEWRFTIPKKASLEACSIIARIPIYLECEDIEKETWELEEVDQLPKVIKTHRPIYPKELKREGIQGGNVVLSIIIDETGKPQDIKIVSTTHRGFAEAAIEAAKEFIFSPGYYQGKPVQVKVRLPIEFLLR